MQWTVCIDSSAAVLASLMAQTLFFEDKPMIDPEAYFSEEELWLQFTSNMQLGGPYGYLWGTLQVHMTLQQNQRLSINQ